MMPRRTFCLLALLAALDAGCGRSSPPPQNTEEVDRLLGLMQQRLALMHDVARWKWNQGRPIADLQRERELLDRLSTDGQDRRMNPGFVRSFFTAQIEAAKQMQQADFERWRKEKKGKFSDVVPLAELRKRIDALNADLLTALEAVRLPVDELNRRAEGILVGEGIDGEVRRRALKPLIDFSPG